jgi:hypothetical protein
VVDNEIELEIGDGDGAGRYVVRVVHASGGGEPTGTLQLDVEDLIGRRRQLEDTVLASAARARRRNADDEPLRRVGQQLFEALFAGPIAGAYRASLTLAREREEKLRVVLRLTAPELAALPWEALWDPELEAYLCRREPLVRHIPAPYTPAPLEVRTPLRILGLTASPRDLPALDEDSERRCLEAALSDLTKDGQIVVEWLTQASWGSVQDRLLTGQWHILHFIGHGAYDQDADEGRVALVGEDGRADWVGASRLADLLDQASPTPRLVVLNSCSTGDGGTRDLFSSTAATLVHSGISAVAAMQFSVSDQAAGIFPRGLYSALAAGRGIDEAVQSGRIAILGLPHSLEWVTPVLYLRGAATQLFALPTEVKVIPPPSITERIVAAVRDHWLWLLPLVAVALVISVVLVVSGNGKSKSGGSATIGSTTINVPSTQIWTNTGLDVAVGDKVTITATGTVNNCDSDSQLCARGPDTFGPDGDPACWKRQFNVLASQPDGSDCPPGKGVNHASLIGIVSSSGVSEKCPSAGLSFPAGHDLEFVAQQAGSLYLGINDCGVADNKGSFRATIKVKKG